MVPLTRFLSVTLLYVSGDTKQVNNNNITFAVSYCKQIIQHFSRHFLTIILPLMASCPKMGKKFKQQKQRQEGSLGIRYIWSANHLIWKPIPLVPRSESYNGSGGELNFPNYCAISSWSWHSESIVACLLGVVYPAVSEGAAQIHQGMSKVTADADCPGGCWCWVALPPVGRVDKSWEKWSFGITAFELERYLGDNFIFCYRSAQFVSSRDKPPQHLTK